MKRGVHRRKPRPRPHAAPPRPGHGESVRKAGEQLELDDAELDDLEAALARLRLELEA